MTGHIQKMRAQGRPYAHASSMFVASHCITLKGDCILGHAYTALQETLIPFNESRSGMFITFGGGIMLPSHLESSSQQGSPHAFGSGHPTSTNNPAQDGVSSDASGERG